jgi:ring-1,2-phenylacetyl-CoA epoxidase subunit PaaB
MTNIRIVRCQVMADALPLWEVFVRSKRGLDHRHVGSLHAADAAQALEYARDTYTRRGEGVSIWVVRSSDIVASQADDAASFFDPQNDKPFRHAAFYRVPNGVENL